MNSINDLMKVSPSVAKEYIIDTLQAGLVPFIIGSPGIGKSQLIKEIAKELNLKVIDHRLSTSDPTDLSGLPSFRQKENGKQIATFSPFDIFPTEYDEIPKGYAGFLLFFDELNSASEEVQAATYKTILDRQIGQYKLNDDCLIVCAGNEDTDKAIVKDLSTAMVSRLVHIHMQCDVHDWLENVAYPQKYDPRIIAYISYQPKALMDFNPNNEETLNKTFCCPRSWEFVNRLLKVPNFKVDISKQPLLQGIISSNEAIRFTQFCLLAHKLVSYDEIIENPDSAYIPEDDAAKWFMITVLLQNYKEEDLEKIDIYLSRFNRIDFEVLFYRALKNQDNSVLSNSIFIKRMSKIAEYQRTQVEAYR